MGIPNNEVGNQGPDRCPICGQPRGHRRSDVPRRQQGSPCCIGCGGPAEPVDLPAVAKSVTLKTYRYACLYCGKRFRNLSALDCHVNQSHTAL